MYTYVFLSSLGKASTISEKGLLTPYTVVGDNLVPSRSNGGPVEWLMSKHWKKSFHPSFVPLSSPYLFFFPSSFLPLLFPVSRLPKDTRPLKNSKEQKWRDRQIYRGISFAGCAWQILDSLNRLSSFSLFPSFPANVSTTYVHPCGVMDSSCEKIKKSFLIYRQPIIVLSLKGAYNKYTWNNKVAKYCSQIISLQRNHV